MPAARKGQAMSPGQNRRNRSEWKFDCFPFCASLEGLTHDAPKPSYAHTGAGVPDLDFHAKEWYDFFTY